MKKIYLITSAVLFIMSKGVFAQQSDIITDQTLASVTFFSNSAAITTVDAVQNPDNCALTDFYLLQVAPSALNFPQFLLDGTDTLATVSDTLLLQLKLNSVSINFRVEGCAANRPAIRWVSF